VVASTIGLVWVVATGSSAGASPATVQGSAPNCKVKLSFTPTEVHAIVLAGCQGSDFYLLSWSVPNFAFSPQTLFRSTNEAPYTVALPPCRWQVDFALLSAPPGVRGHSHKLYATRVGGRPCSTVTTTSTTKPPTSTTSTIPKTTSTTATTVPDGTTTVPPSTTTSTTVRPTTTTVQAASPVPASATEPPHPDGGLAFTGANTRLLLCIALAAIGAGLLLTIGRIGSEEKETR
jgi:hypothetical protein